VGPERAGRGLAEEDLALGIVGEPDGDEVQVAMHLGIYNEVHLTLWLVVILTRFVLVASLNSDTQLAPNIKNATIVKLQDAGLLCARYGIHTIYLRQ